MTITTGVAIFKRIAAITTIALLLINHVGDSDVAAKAKVATVLMTMRVPMKDDQHNLDKLGGIT